MNIEAEIRKLQARIAELKKTPVPVKFSKDMITRIGLVVAEEGVAIVTRKRVYNERTWRIRKSNVKHLRSYKNGKKIQAPAELVAS